MLRLAIATWLMLALTTTLALCQTQKRAVEDRPANKEPAADVAPQRASPSPPRWTGPKRGWGPEQAVGPPDTPGAGDLTTAWASASQDDQEEWLICEYEQPLQAMFLHVHETYHPGALVKVTAFGPDGKEITAWEGEDPTPRTEARGVSKIPIALGANARRFKLYFDSPAVRGWNEIDAVAVEDDKGASHWAVHVEASSTFAREIVEPVRPARMPLPQGPSPFEKLQQEVAELKNRDAQQREEIRELRQELRELRESLSKERRAR
ncbi:hypothetical protein Pan44_53080 [Caulifigura coniformis]|uniref:F5/8 type C domain protein n=1 Tax=Caulifigura coniformis TaxID=2527983 RepID=A0A517SM82_9PLAN|nr:hypothetical protein [Caulifigura coniformis]QDT57240.1 hypothetical protein Pan44_53080 [Caulifigura coniformis]